MTNLKDDELASRLRELAIKLFPSANEWAIKEGVKNICNFLSEVNPGEYRQLYHSLFIHDTIVKNYDSFCPLKERLEKLAIRLENEGRYTDSDICWLNLKRDE